MHPEPSVHDNVIYAYSVDCEGRRLVLHTAFRDQEPHEFTDISFRDVVAHHFEHALPGNIVFDVEESDLAALIRDNAGLFVDSWRYGWPPVEYGGDLSELESALKAASVRAFSIRSSFGLSGWVLAASCERVLRGGPARVLPDGTK